MAVVGATAITAYANKIFADAWTIARDNNLMAGLVTTFNDRSGTAIRQSSTYNAGTIATLGDETDLTGGTFTPSSTATLSPTEVGAQFVISDLRLETDPFAVRQDAALELGFAIAQKLEVDLLAAGTSVTGGTVASNGTAPTFGNFSALEARLRAQNAPKPYYAVMHPYHWHGLAKVLTGGQTVTNGPSAQDEVMAQWYVGTLMGVDVFTSANITAGTAAPITMFSPLAIALDLRRPPRLELQRDASLRAWELNMTAVYAAGAWRPKFGVYGTFDASVPSS